ncbi:hypothetical protein KBD49_13365 [Myxococcota bacterium]|nr:hypothetical protein [Myxococcota bacterium]
MRPATILWFGLGLALAMPAATAQESWDREKGNCEGFFQSPDEAPLAELQTCLKIWEAYRDVRQLSEPQRQTAARAFQRVFRDGDPESRYLARTALGRLGFAPETAQAGTAQQAPKRKKYRAHPAGEEDQKAALQIRKKGMDRYQKKDWEGAIALFEQALERDPASTQLLYDAACAHALAGHREMAVEYLLRLADLATPDAMAKLAKARKDKDFDRMREDPDFKRATGYAKVKVLNGMPPADEEIGEDNVFRLAQLLRNPKLGYVVEEGGKDKHPRSRPHVWFKDHAKAQAVIVMKLLGHPRTRLVPIDWDTPFDLIVSWADQVEVVDGEKVCRNGVQQNDPEKRLQQAIADKDSALSRPDDYLAKADEVLSQPEQTVDQVTGLVDQVQGLGDKAKGAVDAVQGAGKKLKVW